MKKNIYCTCLLLFITYYSISQSSVRASFGYGIPLNSDVIMVQVREGYDNDFYQKVKGIYGSYGSGYRLNLAFSRSFKKDGSLNWDIENTFILGKRYISRSLYYDGSEEHERTETRALSYQITPSLVYSIKWKNLAPYVRIGPTFSITKIKNDVTVLTQNLLEIEYSYEYKGGVGLGMKTVLGAAIQASRGVSLFGEISFVSMTYGPTKGWLTKYDVEGSSELDQFSNKERAIDFEKEFTIHPNDTEERTIRTRSRYALGSTSLNLGVRLTF